ncbi:hypothetical protein [Paraferrimonas sedimenticola]|uniref:DUF11 domain-containing protein n=1 Tax=Paraferrimonas sedimenticola TaxID=375674 RepID=A0AA37RXL7_9GAMM|nr:hypothetical protein [Paraferrimonas sedimenticola]GLP96991.1 hypothetical protein GCM10007895_22970 [Paraferrimonas sedimenticola]
MADAWLQNPDNRGKLNCTAEDIEIADVIPINDEGFRAGTPQYAENPVECTDGEVFSLQADVVVRTNAKIRYDYTFYIPDGNFSPQDVQNPTFPRIIPSDPNTPPTDESGYCSLLIGINGEVTGDYDGDLCADINKSIEGDEVTYFNETITMFCSDKDLNGEADFSYCAAWDNTDDNMCNPISPTFPNVPGQIPNTKSKCNCNEINIPVVIRPDPPAISKAVSPASYSEPGGLFTVDVSFKNDSKAPLYIHSITDVIDANNDGVYDDSIDVWGALDTVDKTTEGIYFDSSTCALPNTDGDGDDSRYEVLPDATYSCSFKVYVAEWSLPTGGTQTLGDIVVFNLKDKDGNPLSDNPNQPCDSNYTRSDGDVCSTRKTVSITNLKPEVTVTKSVSTGVGTGDDEILERGGTATYNITISNTSPTDATTGVTPDATVYLSSFSDVFAPTLPSGTSPLNESPAGCLSPATDYALVKGTSYTCQYTVTLAQADINVGEQFKNTVTANVVDKESASDSDTKMQTITVTDVPSEVTLTKTANPTKVGETGDDPDLFRDVEYTFKFEVAASGVDYVIFNKLEDTVETITSDLTPQCMVDTINGITITPKLALGNGVKLFPGDWASCVVTLKLQGDAHDVYENTAEIFGMDADGAKEQDDDNEVVTFEDVEPSIDLAFASKITAFFEITNTGVDTLRVDSFLIEGVELQDGLEKANFYLVETEDTGFADYGDEVNSKLYNCYDLTDETNGPDIAPGETVYCSLHVKVFPGYDNGNIAFLAVDSEPEIKVIVKEKVDDGSSSTDNQVVSATYVTVEP